VILDLFWIRPGGLLQGETEMVCLDSWFVYFVLHYCIIYVNFISSAVTSHVGRYCCWWSEDNRKSKTASLEVDPKLPKKAVFINFWIVEQLVEVIQLLLMSPMATVRSSWARKIPALQVRLWCLVRYDRSNYFRECSSREVAVFHVLYDLLGGSFKYFLLSPLLGKIPILTNIIQVGWNHQLFLECFPNAANLLLHAKTSPWQVS